MVVRFTWQADQQPFHSPDILHGVIDMRWDKDKTAVYFAKVQFIDHTVAWRFGTIIVQHEFQCALVEKIAVYLIIMNSPPFDLTGPYGDGIHEHKWNIIKVPEGAVKLSQCTSVILLRDLLVYLNAIDQTVYAFARTCDCLWRFLGQACHEAASLRLYHVTFTSCDKLL